MEHSEMEKLLDEVEARYEAERLSMLPLSPPDATVPPAFFYLHFKAFGFLHLGPERYREIDYFHLPPAGWPELKLAAVRHGCEQILQFRGLSPDRPLEGIGVGGFYALLRLFHFVRKQQTAFAGTTSDTILDKMEMRHGMDGRELTLYNLVAVKKLGERTDSETPCPYCGQPLRTAFAKQCRHCGMDWHDPENVVCRKAKAK